MLLNLFKRPGLEDLILNELRALIAKHKLRLSEKNGIYTLEGEEFGFHIYVEKDGRLQFEIHPMGDLYNKLTNAGLFKESIGLEMVALCFDKSMIWRSTKNTGKAMRLFSDLLNGPLSGLLQDGFSAWERIHKCAKGDVEDLRRRYK